MKGERENKTMLYNSKPVGACDMSTLHNYNYYAFETEPVGSGGRGGVWGEGGGWMFTAIPLLSSNSMLWVVGDQ